MPSDAEINMVLLRRLWTKTAMSIPDIAGVFGLSPTAMRGIISGAMLPVRMTGPRPVAINEKLFIANYEAGLSFSDLATVHHLSRSGAVRRARRLKLAGRKAG